MLTCSSVSLLITRCSTCYPVICSWILLLYVLVSCISVGCYPCYPAALVRWRVGVKPNTSWYQSLSSCRIDLVDLVVGPSAILAAQSLFLLMVVSSLYHSNTVVLTVFVLAIFVVLDVFDPWCELNAILAIQFVFKTPRASISEASSPHSYDGICTLYPDFQECTG